ncbi:MAG: hypothetical protein RR327_02590, partial [Clostridia bacterium]
EITNNKVKLVVTTGVGPRIMHFGFCDKENVLYVNQSDFLNRADIFKFYGGHRLWHSPEHAIRTYQRDNSQCEVEVLPLGVKVSNYETENKIKKTMQIEMKDNGRVRIIHSIKNCSTFDYNLACWGITQMKGGGVAVFPQDNRRTGLLPNRSIALWDYADLSDKRLTFTSNNIIIKQDPTIEKAFKIGSFNREGYLGYFNDGDLFVKEFDVSEGDYSDYGCNAEIYVNDNFLELESLSAMAEIPENEEISHTETWELFGNVEAPIKEKYQEMDIKEYVNA